MKKVLAITICFLMVLSASSFATKTRVQTMGDNNMIMVDEANIWLFPGRLFQFPDMAVVEYSVGPYVFFPTIGEGTDGVAADQSIQEFGVHWKFGTESPFVLGTYLYNGEGQTDIGAYFNDGFPLGLNTEFLYSFGYTGGDFGFVPDNDLLPGNLEMSNRRIGLFYSRQLSGYNFGFYFDKLHNSMRYEELNTDGDLVNDDDESFSRYTFGFGLSEAQGAWDIALKAALISWRDKEYNYTDGEEMDNTKPAGNYNFQLMGRYFHQYNPTLTFVPHVSVMMSKIESEDYFYNGDWQTDPETYKISGFIVDLGSGMHYTPTAGMLAVLDFGVALAKLNYEETLDTTGAGDFATWKMNTNVTTLPYVKVGFEGEVLSWLDVRFGGTTYWRTFSNEFEDYDGTVYYKETNRYPNNQTYLGFSFNWGNLTVDTWTDPELFLEGLNFISGESTQMNAGLSALYNF
jgi:hypothetical protein